MKPIQYAIDFIDTASRAETLEDLELCLKRALEPLGIMNFGAFAMMSDGVGPRQPTTLFRQTSEEWSAYYWEQNSFNHDVAIHEALVRPRPFTFQQIESRDLSKKARGLFDVMREAMTIGDGYILPVHDSTRFSGLIGLYSVEQKLHPETLTALRMIGLYAVERARTQARVADAMFITGGVLAAAGLVLVLTTLGGKKAKGSADVARSVWSPVVGPQHVGLGLSRRF